MASGDWIALVGVLVAGAALVLNLNRRQRLLTYALSATQLAEAYAHTDAGTVERLDHQADLATWRYLNSCESTGSWYRSMLAGIFLLTLTSYWLGTLPALLGGACALLVLAAATGLIPAWRISDRPPPRAGR